MATPRLKGRALATSRRLTDTATGANAVRGQIFRDYDMPAMLDLPPESRGTIEVDPTPLQARPPRRWRGRKPEPTPGEAATLVDAYVAGTSDPVSVLAALQERVRLGAFGLSRYSPFVATDWERAAEAAAVSAARYAAGEPLGPLDGVPVSVKDEHHMEGLPTRGGTAYLDVPADLDSFTVQRLRQAGAVVFAKTHATEWGMNPLGQNPHFHMPRNPYDAKRAAGGSSTGAGVSVALGFNPMAIGSDGGGSIRIPAAMTGVFGLKPTWIRIGRSGNIFGKGSVSHIGPLGASTRDLVDLLSTVAAKPDPADVRSVHLTDLKKAVPAWRKSLTRGIRGCHIGVPRGEWAMADPALAARAMKALEALEADGAVLVDVHIPLARHAPTIGVLAIATETMGGLADDHRAYAASMGDDLRLLLNIMGTVSARDYFLANRTRTRLREQTADAFALVDLIALPTLRSPPPAYPLSEDGVAVSDAEATRAACRFNFLGNLTGLPAGTVPVGLEAGLPVGLQLMGDAWDEASVLAAMAHCERLGLCELPRPKGHQGLV